MGSTANTLRVTVVARLLANCASAFAADSTPQSKPNIVLLFIDDWAWNGTPVPMDDRLENSHMPVLRMPNVERLAREGMKFTSAYGSPQCSPSRVCVQTGQSSPRNGFTVYMNDRGQEYYDEKGDPSFPVIPCVSDMTIDKDAVTIPEALKPLGYVSAHIGKWHMRGDPGDEGYVLHDGDTNNNPGNTLPDDAKQRVGNRRQHLRGVGVGQRLAAQRTSAHGGPHATAAWREVVGLAGRHPRSHDRPRPRHPVRLGLSR
jgi:arylsulfatase A-like enzyme